MNLNELALATEQMDEGAFLAAHPYPSLVFLTEATRLEDTPAHDTVEDMSLEDLARGRKALRMSDPIPLPGSSNSPTQHGAAAPPDDRAVTPSSSIYFLEKSNRNPFGSMITVGRATNNDVVLPLRTVSKMHAYFMAATGPVWKITDQHSANGTYVDSLKLPNGQGATLSDGARIGFGAEVQCRFFSPQGLFRIIVAFRPHVVRNASRG